jgi:DNA (cytosine-5)-methyltransferase 1
MSKKIKVAELFAGVGGFRIGLEGWQGKSASSKYKENFNSSYEVVWSNQWEPLTKSQPASDIYAARWGEKNHSNEDIAEVETKSIPNFDMLVGGFPCQDYSVATTLKNSKGLIGKKGVLWWSIYRILNEVKKKPDYLLLENVDRLLISPSKQRGRDFAIILQSLNSLGYAVEWRVINAADYGMPQRRRRVFFFAYKATTKIYKQLSKDNPEDWISSNGVIADAFPIKLDSEKIKSKTIYLDGDIVNISDNFNSEGHKEMFLNSGVMINGKVVTMKVEPDYKGKRTTLKNIVADRKNIEEEFFIKDDELEQWKYLKGAKREYRKDKSGFEYFYTEGGMIFPEPMDMPSRTIITGEGGRSPSRFKHVVNTKNGLRRLIPMELERLNMFPDNFTEHEEVTPNKRAFLMGNALVIGVVEKLGESLAKRTKGK